MLAMFILSTMKFISVYHIFNVFTVLSNIMKSMSTDKYNTNIENMINRNNFIVNNTNIANINDTTPIKTTKTLAQH